MIEDTQKQTKLKAMSSVEKYEKILRAALGRLFEGHVYLERDLIKGRLSETQYESAKIALMDEYAEAIRGLSQPDPTLRKRGVTFMGTRGSNSQ